MIVYLARDIPAFVMYCVNGESGSSLLIESSDSDNIYMCIYGYIFRVIESSIYISQCTMDSTLSGLAW